MEDREKAVKIIDEKMKELRPMPIMDAMGHFAGYEDLYQGMWNGFHVNGLVGIYQYLATIQHRRVMQGLGPTYHPKEVKDGPIKSFFVYLALYACVLLICFIGWISSKIGDR